MKGFSIQKKFRFGRRTNYDPVKEKEKYSAIVADIIKISDVVLEVLDARFIKETRNLEVEKLIKSQGKEIIFVINKSDLVNLKKLRESLPEEMHPRVFISCKTGKGGKILRDRIKIEAKRANTRANFNRKHIGIIGYPNTGKSSLINFLLGRKVAKTSIEAGFTRGMQKIKLAENILLIDTPGVIPEKEYASERLLQTGKHSRICARSYGQVKDPRAEVYSLLDNYSEIIQRYYGFKDLDFDDFIEQLGRKNHFLLKGNAVDEERTFRMILKDWQLGNIRII